MPEVLDMSNPLTFDDDPFAQKVADAVANHPFLNRPTGEPVAAPAPVATPVADPPADDPADDAPTTDLPAPDPTTQSAPNSPATPDVPESLDPAELARLQALASWARGLRPDVAQQFGYIESGQAVAVPTDEFAAYQAWRRTNSQQQTSGASTTPDWAADLEPEARQAFAELQRQRDDLAAQRDRAEQSALVPQHQAEVQRRAEIFQGAITSYGTEHGFTDDQAGELMDVAVRSGVIPNLLEAHRVYSPSGLLVQEADFATVATDALNFARIRRPDLTPAGAPSPAAVNPNIPVPAPVETPAQAAVSTKKILASHLATAPSAATNPLGNTPTGPLDMSQQRAVIADLLRSQGLAR